MINGIFSPSIRKYNEIIYTAFADNGFFCNRNMFIKAFLHSKESNCHRVICLRKKGKFIQLPYVLAFCGNDVHIKQLMLYYLPFIDHDRSDLNKHVERNNDVNARLLSNVLDMFSMQNVIKETSHMHGGTLDLVVPVINMPVTRVRVYPSGVISDHSSVSICLPTLKQEWFKLHHGSIVTVEELNVIVEELIRPARIVPNIFCSLWPMKGRPYTLPYTVASLGLVSPGAVTHGVTPLMTPHRHTAFLA
ncbi:hypothetical protein HELRODRAFT_172937 [Helobdella robusta]|uniref:Endonuclease/exonuclease/phosphatase domain-containing protein n=1 Tax=Helobdella robusta TaxID=6412 RepID=T1F660_HELRO|nr:hypothetical protein HELRODRAFT_172937 [Helobdella robusta]ESO03909.1 hypothetical protein HELRODRAFT_172937 [Helobdella robusta]